MSRPKKEPLPDMVVTTEVTFKRGCIPLETILDQLSEAECNTTVSCMKDTYKVHIEKTIPLMTEAPEQVYAVFKKITNLVRAVSVLTNISNNTANGTHTQSDT